ncbi:MAG: hypothetical protein DMF84_19100 [Acidobacteria bacterium]|nr:MAG: hypothetical protein DMF84_19100 [Acidobacteriota bacterium]
MRRSHPRDRARRAGAAPRDGARRGSHSQFVQSKGSRVNKFEFVILSSARAKQLLKGCTPKTTTAIGSEKLVRLAMKEVKEHKVEAVKQVE